MVMHPQPPSGASSEVGSGLADSPAQTAVAFEAPRHNDALDRSSPSSRSFALAVDGCSRPPDAVILFVPCGSATHDATSGKPLANHDQHLSAQAAQLQRLLLLPALASFKASTLDVTFADPRSLLQFLNWCLEKDQTRLLSQSTNAEGDIVDVLDRLRGRRAANRESSLAVWRLCLLFNRYREQGYLPIRAAGPIPAAGDEESVVLQDDLDSTRGPSAYESRMGSLEPENSGLDTWVQEGLVNMASPGDDDLETALGLSLSAWPDGLLEHLASHLDDLGL